VPPPRRSLELTVPGESWVHPLPGTVTGATCADTAGRSATGVLARQSQGTSATGRREACQQGQGQVAAPRDAATGDGGDSDGGGDVCMVVDAASASPPQLGSKSLGDTWIMDSGASYTFTPQLSDFYDPLTEPETDIVRVGSSATMPVHGMGSVRVIGEDGQVLTLTKVHYVPGHALQAPAPLLTSCAGA